MSNLMTTTTFVKNEILTELRNGNTEVLKGLPPHMAMSLGMALQNETDYKEHSHVNDREVGKAMLSRMADSGIKEQLIKQIEQEEKEHAEKVAKAKEITKEVTS
jgi:hypothetical protein